MKKFFLSLVAGLVAITLAAPALAAPTLDEVEAKEQAKLDKLDDKATYKVESQYIKSEAKKQQIKLKYAQKMELDRQKREVKFLQNELKAEDKLIKRLWQQEDALVDEANANKEHYFLFAKDDMFSYYMDTRYIKWRRYPFKADEFIVDVWIRIVENDLATAFADGKIDYLPRYYLEHYYLYPAGKEIQFLSEQEISIRPDNDIIERKYSPTNWEPVVPGSLEDTIFYGVTRNMTKYNLIGSKDGKERTILDRFHTVTSSVAEALRIEI